MVRQAPNGQYPVGAQGGAVYGTPSAHQQPSGATGAGYGHAQPTVNQQAQPGYYQAPSPMPQVQPVGAPSYGSVGAMPPRQKSHAGLIIGIVVAILVILLMIVFAAIATSTGPVQPGRHPRLGRHDWDADRFFVWLLFGVIVWLVFRHFFRFRAWRLQA